MAHNNKVLNPSFSIPLIVPMNMQGQQVFNIAPPTDSDDAVTLSYLNSRLSDSESRITYRLEWNETTRVLSLVGYNSDDSEVSRDTEEISGTDITNLDFDTDTRVLTLRTSDTEFMVTIPADTEGGSGVTNLTFDSDTGVLTLTTTDTEYTATIPAGANTTYTLANSSGPTVVLTGSDGSSSSHVVTGVTPGHFDSETIIHSYDTWVSGDSEIATTAAIDARAQAHRITFGTAFDRNRAINQNWKTSDRAVLLGYAYPLHNDVVAFRYQNVDQADEVSVVFETTTVRDFWIANYLAAGRNLFSSVTAGIDLTISTISNNNSTIPQSYPNPLYRGWYIVTIRATANVNDNWRTTVQIPRITEWDHTQPAGDYWYAGSEYNNAATTNNNWLDFHFDTSRLDARIDSENLARSTADATERSERIAADQTEATQRANADITAVNFNETNRTLTLTRSNGNLTTNIPGGARAENIVGGNGIAVSETGDTETISLDAMPQHSVRVAQGSTTPTTVAVDPDQVLGRNGTGDLTGTTIHTNMIEDHAVTAPKIASGVIPNLPNREHRFTRDSDGLVPAPGAAQSNRRFLRDDGSWVELSDSEAHGLSFESLTDTPNTYDSDAGDFVRVNSAENGLDFFNPFPVDAATGRLTVLNGLTLRSIDTTQGSPALIFAHWEWQTPTLVLDDSDNVRSSNTTLHWDAPFEGIDFSYPNHSDLPNEFVQRILAVGMFDGSNQIWSGRDYGPFTHQTPLTYEFDDSEVLDNNIHGRANGASGRSLTLRGRMRNNTYPTVADQDFSFGWSWGPVGFSGTTITIPGITGSSQNFDRVIDTDLTAVFQAEATRNMNNITPATSSLHTVHSDGTARTYAQQGNLTVDHTNDRFDGRYSSDTEAVYWHTAIVSDIAASFIRPNDNIQADTDLINRTALINIVTPQTNSGLPANEPFRRDRRTPAYPVWKVESTGENFSTSLLGALSNSGYSETPELAYSTNANLVRQGTSHTYTATNSTTENYYMHIVAKYVAGRTLSYREVSNPAFPATVTPVRTDNNVALGHTTGLAASESDTQRFEVITFNIPANSTINIQIS